MNRACNRRGGNERTNIGRCQVLCAAALAQGFSLPNVKSCCSTNAAEEALDDRWMEEIDTLWHAAQPFSKLFEAKQRSRHVLVLQITALYVLQKKVLRLHNLAWRRYVLFV